jgi:serine protease AprX
MPNTAVTWRTTLFLFALTCPSQAGAQLSSTAAPTTSSASQPVETVSLTSSITPTITTILGKLDRPLRERLYLPWDRSRVIIRALDAASVAPVALLINDIGGTPGINLPILDAQVADVPNSALPILAASPNIKYIALDRDTVGTVERTGVTVGATAVRQQHGYDGTGVGVAVIDSGVTSWHDDLAETGIPGSQRIDRFIDFVNGRTTAYDDNGHGTHVAGIIAGNGYDSSGGRSGMAPGARLVVLKVLDSSSQGHISDVIAAFDYVLNHKDLLQIRVVNLSVGAKVYDSYKSDLLTLAAKRVVEEGVVVVASAGNGGRNSQSGGVQYGGILAPANAPWVLTVGASSHMGTADRADDTIAAFSSRGPTANDYAAKPDLVAPGVGIYSLSDPNSALYSSRSAYLRAGTVATTYLPYLSLSGTSQAAPVVAGVVALMLQANPSLTPNAVKAILQYTAQEYEGNSALEQGAGYLNAAGAVELARLFATSANYYSPQPEWSAQIIWANHRIRGGLLQEGASAWKSGVVWGDPANSNGEPISWGVICSTVDCQSLQAGWRNWGTTCVDPSCSGVVWGDATSENVVWGWACGGSDCDGRSWMVGDDDTVQSTQVDDDTVVWGNQDDDTVVWGNQADDDTVVWGNQDDDTVVWGNQADDDTVVWGNTDNVADPVTWEP